MPTPNSYRDSWSPILHALKEKAYPRILTLLEKQTADLVLLQEVARSSYGTYGIDTLAALTAKLKGHAPLFCPDFRS